MLIDFNALRQQTQDSPLAAWTGQLRSQMNHLFNDRKHGDFSRWMEVISKLPQIPAAYVDLDADTVRASGADPLYPNQRTVIEKLLMQLHPWRKGPFSLHGVYVDSEWRSDWKWRRLEQHISPLAGRSVLDVGCGNGYHCWRMVGAGARLAVGIDPTQLYLAQFLAVRHFLGTEHPVHVLPFSTDAMPEDLKAFDSVFSMGVLYHRRSPIDHLLDLKSYLRRGGELVLETLVIEGAEGQVLLPPGRYAKMRNVWFLPSPATLHGWLKRCGFSDIRLLDVSATSVEEQRATGWMRFESLADFLDPRDNRLTLEGYPSPVRALFIARC